MIAELARVARTLLPGDVALAVVDPRIAPPPVWPEEAPAMAGMVAARRREFAAGRAAIRTALRVLGAPPAAVPMGPDRAPLWPEGIVGSLSHIPSACLAVVAHAARFRSLGVDLEEGAALPEDLWDAILIPAERDWLAAQPAPDRGGLARLIFSAKEAAYKAQYPLSRQVLEFSAMQIVPDLAAGRFDACFTGSAGPFRAGDRLDGQLACGGGWLMTVVAIPATRSGASSR